MKKLIFALLLLSFIPVKSQIQKLKIGDKFPDIELRGVFNYKDSSVRLSDFKGKLVILDIWSNWCSTCIEGMPQLQKLQKKFKKEIQIFTVNPFTSKKLVIERLKTNAFVKDIWLPCITDTILNMNNILEYNSIPHEIWIDKDGVIKAFTSAELVNEKNISEMLGGKEVKWRMKVSNTFDGDMPLLSKVNNAIQSPIYYTTLTGFFEGDDQARSPIKLLVDSNKNYARSCHVNVPILSLYRRTLSSYPEIFNSGNRTILEIKDSARYFYYKSKEYFGDWSSKNTYCYEAILPINISTAEFEELMRNDLNRYLRLNGRIETKNTICLVVKKSNAYNTEIHDVKYDNKSGNLVYIEISELIAMWNKSPDHIPAILETKSLGKERIVIDKIEYGNIGLNEVRIEKILHNNGFVLKKENRKIPMFVLTEP